MRQKSQTVPENWETLEKQEDEQIIHRLQKSRDEYMDMNIPEEGLERMKDAIHRAKQEKKNRRHVYRRRIGLSLAAAFAVVCLVPNCSETYAQALMDIPVFGGFFKVITVRDYQFDDGHSSADVKIPELDERSTGFDKESSAAADVNRSVEEYTGEILEQFKKNQKKIGKQGYQSLNISYDVLTNTERWFTLELTVDEVQGSGYESKQYYHIDKTTGRIASLKDLFVPGSNYLETISGYIKEQMEQYNKESEEGQGYWIGKTEFEDGYQGIDENQSFYLDKDGSLVIVFDEYEVAPGYMGMPQFKIPEELTAGMRRF